MPYRLAPSQPPSKHTQTHKAPINMGLHPADNDSAWYSIQLYLFNESNPVGLYREDYIARKGMAHRGIRMPLVALN
jgi:hypothetical protein